VADPLLRIVTLAVVSGRSNAVFAVIADLAPFELNWMVAWPIASPETETPPAAEIVVSAFSADEIAPAVAE
jgi:hypothetical protein